MENVDKVHVGTVLGGAPNASMPMSVGGLPRGPIVPRFEPTYITSANDPAQYFSIGSRPKTQPIPDAVLIRGNEEMRRRNDAYEQQAGTQTSRAREPQMAGVNALPPARLNASGQPRPKFPPNDFVQGGGSGNGASANTFLNQNMTTPSNRIL